MVTTTLLALVLVAQQTDCGTKPDPGRTTLVVQVIDELWLPLPGAEVTIRQGKQSRPIAQGLADGSGFVRLVIAKPGVYEVEASLIGFKTHRVGKIGVDADPSKSIPHVQVKLKVSVPKEVVSDSFRPNLAGRDAVEGSGEPSNKGMKLTSAERIGRSQLIPGVGQTCGGEHADD